MALAGNIQCLFQAVNDENLQVRRSAARVIGRASRQQSTMIMPFVRVALVQLGRHLDVSQDPAVKKERILILTDLLASAGSLVRPFVSSIMPPLLLELLGSSGAGGGGGGGGGGVIGGGHRLSYLQQSRTGRLVVVVVVFSMVVMLVLFSL